MLTQLLTLPWHGGYSCFNDNPILYADPLGLWPFKRWFSRAGSKGPTGKHNKNSNRQRKMSHKRNDFTGTRTQKGNNNSPKNRNRKVPSRVRPDKISSVYERQVYTKEIWNNESIDDGLIAFFPEGDADKFSTDFDSWELKAASDRGEMNSMYFNLSNFSFKHVEGSGYDPIHTVITIPRNDGKGVFEIHITGNLDGVEVIYTK
jgi:hypothetical protein